MAYSPDMVFKETRVFTRQIDKLLTEEQYRMLQRELLFNPAAGDVIQRSGGLRKLRWRAFGRGKRGGIRVIYYWFNADHEIYLLLAYGKNEKDDLSNQELKVLRSLVEEELI